MPSLQQEGKGYYFIMTCKICQKNVHYGTCCGYYADGEYEVCYECWTNHELDKLYARSEVNHCEYEQDPRIIETIEIIIRNRKKQQ